MDGPRIEGNVGGSGPLPVVELADVGLGRAQGARNGSEELFFWLVALALSVPFEIVQANS